MFLGQAILFTSSDKPRFWGHTGDQENQESQYKHKNKRARIFVMLENILRLIKIG